MKQYKKLSLRLSEKQYRHLRKNANAAGMKMEPYMRDLIMGHEIKPYPPEAYRGLLKELSAIGNNINQIAHIANAQQNISNDKIYEAIRLVGEVMRIVREGELLRATGGMLEEHGYEVKVLNLVDMARSDCYNPLAYVRTDTDALRLVTNLVKNTTPTSARTSRQRLFTSAVEWRHI